MTKTVLFAALLTACGGDGFSASETGSGATFDDAGPSAAGSAGTPTAGGFGGSAGHGGEGSAGSPPDAGTDRPDSDAGGVSAGGSPPVQIDSGSPEGGGDAAAEPDAEPPMVCPKYEEPDPSGAGCVCVDTHTRCDEYCVPLSPEFGCGVGDCSPCPAPPEHATSICWLWGCEWTCDDGYHLSRDGTFCAPDCEGTMVNCGENETCVSAGYVNGCGDPDCTPCQVDVPTGGTIACVAGECDFVCSGSWVREGDACVYAP